MCYSLEAGFCKIGELMVWKYAEMVCATIFAAFVVNATTEVSTKSSTFAP